MFRKLRGRLAENELDQKYLETLLKRSHIYISDRMTGRRPWSMDDVYTICDLMNIPEDEISIYFPRGGEETSTGKMAQTILRQRLDEARKLSDSLLEAQMKLRDILRSA